MFSRRSALAGLGSLLALAPAEAAAPDAPGKPPRLRPGDTVGLVAPATFTDDLIALEGIKSNISALGLVPKVGRWATARYGYLAGPDRLRAEDINLMYADDDVRALFAIQGGWGSARILPWLDWKTIRSRPKLLVGMSDITALHLAFAARAGFPTIHGPNAASSWQEVSRDSLKAVAFDAGTPLLANPPLEGMDPAVQERWRTTTIRPGRATGRLLGGNLTVLASLVGTPWVPDFEGAILFLEDTGEAEYRIDRLLTQLQLAGILGKAAAVIFGQCTRCSTDTPDYRGFTVAQLLQQHLGPLGVPAFAGANIGHVGNQLCVPVGVRAEVDAAAGTIRILEPAVA